MKRKIYRLDDEDHASILTGLLWFFGIIIALSVLAYFR